MRRPEVYIVSNMYKMGAFEEMTQDFIKRGKSGIFYRLKCAWYAFTGKYDLIIWRNKKNVVFSEHIKRISPNTLELNYFRLIGTQDLYGKSGIEKLRKSLIFIGSRVEFKSELYLITDIDYGMTDPWTKISNPIRLTVKKIEYVNEV